MNACQDDFLISGFCKSLYFFDDLFRISAPYPSSHVRDDAVSAELIASILYFDIRPCVFPGRIDIKLLEFVGVIDVYYVFPFLLVKMCLKKFQKIFFLIISDQDIDSLDFLTFCLLSLDIASCCHYDSIRI